ncbi:MAG: hypothetical protein LWX83_06260 [Anaerolineae bacterium]|nr:hypothetical protein [Anaerolineae bacterium]
MTKVKRCFLFCLILVLAACSQPTALATNTAVKASATYTGDPNALPTPQVMTTHAPDVQGTANSFLTAWKSSQYQTMYDMLSPLSKEAHTSDDFIKYYRDCATNLTLKDIDFTIKSTLKNPDTAQVNVDVIYHTNLFKDIERQVLINLSLDQGQWKIAWEEGAVMPELKGGNKLALDMTIPSRGNILDRNGSAIAAESDAVALGYIPVQVPQGMASTLIGMIAQLTGESAHEVSIKYEKAWDTPYEYVPVGEVTLEQVQRYYEQLVSAGMIMENYKSRFYYDGGIASQVVGYTLFISESQKEEYMRKGYNGSEKVGFAGLEKWGETYLMGERGAKLYVLDSVGQPVTMLMQTESKPAANIYTTFDNNFQEDVEKSLRGLNGSIVVLERDTGRILAMASSPTYDPNLFDPSNNNSRFSLSSLLNDPDNPQLNRATQSSYPPGSVFKVVTLAAALESGLYPANFTYECGTEFTELPDVTLYDWTHWKGYKASGTLTLAEGLMRSCDPLFYHLGLDMFRKHMPNAISDMARSFGLGSPTGVEQIAEDSGSIPDPQTEGDAVQMGIGQGALLVTPLQMADYIAAVGNGGTLYRSQIVEKVERPDGEQLLKFEPEERGKLPVTPENLKIIQDAMYEVVANPRGTAHGRFLGLEIEVHGKTGTATSNDIEKEHAWFAGYTNMHRTDRPDIAIVVMAEHAGEGSEVAAPIFRRVVEYYFFDRPMTVYPWETTFFVTRTPTPLPPDTPTPGPSETPSTAAG